MSRKLSISYKLDQESMQTTKLYFKSKGMQIEKLSTSELLHDYIAWGTICFKIEDSTTNILEIEGCLLTFVVKLLSEIETMYEEGIVNGRIANIENTYDLKIKLRDEEIILIEYKRRFPSNVKDFIKSTRKILGSIIADLDICYEGINFNPSLIKKNKKYVENNPFSMYI